MYSGGATPNTKVGRDVSEAERLHDAHMEVTKSIGEVVRRLSAFRYSVLGPQPESAGGKGISPQPSGFIPSLQVEVDAQKEALGEAHSILSALEQRLAFDRSGGAPQAYLNNPNVAVGR